MLISTLKIISNIARMNDTGKNNHPCPIFAERFGIYSTECSTIDNIKS